MGVAEYLVEFDEILFALVDRAFDMESVMFGLSRMQMGAMYDSEFRVMAAAVGDEMHLPHEQCVALFVLLTAAVTQKNSGVMGQLFSSATRKRIANHRKMADEVGHLVNQVPMDQRVLFTNKIEARAQRRA